MMLYLPVTISAFVVDGSLDALMVVGCSTEDVFCGGEGSLLTICQIASSTTSSLIFL
jgi:hypothetical protein